jgi:hypothetical protein
MFLNLKAVTVRFNGERSAKRRSIDEMPNANSSLIEQRAIARKRVLVGGVVVTDGGNVSFRCNIKDITTESARITIPGGQPLPPDVYLINLRDQTAHQSKVMWLRGANAGLHFLNSIDLSTATNTSVRFLRQICANNSPK